ncbi:MAG: phosphatidylserine/phosphatidylglycerophosphate/cardiolipin synthase family protein [Deltaproteobacteria bacterium]|nr:phosphatidylserine/phosphatidylglycerophosphate/cardiolipin synthase family protein [Deltaproteobacteria bacterium]
MRFRRPALILPADADTAGLARLVGVLAPEAVAVAACTWTPGAGSSAFGSPAWELLAAALARGDAALDALAAALGAPVALARREAGLAFAPDAVTSIVREFDADVLVVAGAGEGASRPAATWVARSARALGVPVVWWAEGAAIPEPTRATHLLCPFERVLEPLGPIASFLTEHDPDIDRVTFLGLSAARRGHVPPPAALAEVSGLRAEVRITFADDGSLIDTLDLIRDTADRLGAGFVCLPFAAATGLLQAAVSLVAPQLLAQARHPLILVPGELGVGRFGSVIRLDAADAVATWDAALRVQVACLGPFDLPQGGADDAVVLVAGGAVVARAAPLDGRASFCVSPEAALHHDALGLARGQDPRAVEQLVRVVRPDDRRVLVFHAELASEHIARLATLEPLERRRLIAVRMRPTTSCRELRARLAAIGLHHIRLVDAPAILDSGDPGEAPQSADRARLLRVARHLRASGFAVDAIVGAGHRPLSPPGIAWFAEVDLATTDDATLLGHIERLGTVPGAAGQPLAADAILDELTSAPAVGGNAVRVEVDNAEGRAALLEVVAAAERWVHLQSYIVRDDPLTRDIEEALRLATARGVAVRVLVDSLYSLHGSFGAENALLARLAVLPGVEVRASGRIDGVPDLEALKHRDHRKILSVDGVVAIVTGRNLAASYYRSFGEVPLEATTPQEGVPWLDASALVRGPAVAEIDDAFMSAWRAAGGLAWTRRVPEPVGDTRVRVVIHRGLEDTRTLDAYVALIRQARQRLTVVNGFPVSEPLSRALVGAAERGVRVRILFGHFRALHADGTPFPGVAPLHELADQVAHGRIDHLVEAGVEAYGLVVRDGPAWGADVSAIKPHVHAKLISVDGRVCTVGSANFDVTAGYWEDEVLVIVEDEGVTAQLDEALDRLIEGSERANPQDPAWRTRAASRRWLSKHWPPLLR